MAPALFWSNKFERRVKKWLEPKKLFKQKTIFFMPVNYAKEFLNFVHTGIVFSELFSRASDGRRYSRSWNFQLKISLCSVFQHAQFKFHGCSWIWDFGLALLHRCWGLPLFWEMFSTDIWIMQRDLSNKYFCIDFDLSVTLTFAYDLSYRWF